MHMILEFNILSYMRVALLTERALQGAEIMHVGFSKWRQKKRKKKLKDCEFSKGLEGYLCQQVQPA